ncbi:hypothetical protein ABW20_dc0106601 [Dactylellina cionopaga]|nr:hypothetical protein ABW20_dc0106601 [Dactylellina cionopaga]
MALSSQMTAAPSSPCWDKAQKIFLTEFRNSKRFSESAAVEFLNSNYRIDKAINSCIAMKTKADQEYGNKRGRFASKLLNALRTVKDIGDAFLEFAPESISIAWSAVSLLIKVGTDDLDKCELISECCENIVMIVLNCRLYENRYNDKFAVGALQEIEQKIMGIIPNLLYLILDFSWHAHYHIDKSKLLRSFKECFSNTLKNKIDVLIAEYQKLRSMAEDAFQEKVMEQLSSLAVNLGQDINELQQSLFPSIQDLTLKIDLIDQKIENIDNHLQKEEILTTYLDACQRFKPLETHTKLFLTTFEQIRDDYKSMSLWLFADQSYREWQDVSNTTISLLCLKGPRGFGKSVKMTCVIKQLMEESSQSSVRDSLVLFFYFKKGDDNTQYTYKALESLCFQLLNQKIIHNDVQLIKKCTEILEEAPSIGDSSPQGARNQRSLGISVEYLVEVFKKVAELIGRPIFIAVDAIDECEDRSQGKLLYWLKNLCRSTRANIKIICSSRENINIESLLQDERPKGLSDMRVEGKDDTPELSTDIRILLIDEKSNEMDLRMYLMKRVDSIVLRRVGSGRGKLFDQELERVINIIQTKANGNFTYATMVVSNLEQPTKSTLESKLSQLPPAMEGMYRRSLEALSPDERSLVVFALKWVVWGSHGISLLEVIEHYKGIYYPRVPEDQKVSDLESRGVANKNIAEGHEVDLQSVDGIGDQPLEYDPYVDPEIRDTLYHLRSSGRDFFQFDEITDSITAHLSVIEWVQSEAKQFAEVANKPTAPIFRKDEGGQWILSLPIPGKYR